MTGVVFSMLDITGRHQAALDLQVERARFAALVEHSSDVICILDVDSVLRYASPSYQGVYGEDPEPRIGAPVIDRLHVDDRAAFLTLLTRLSDSPQKRATMECRITRADNTLRHVEVTATDHLDDPAIAGIVTNSRDVTDRVDTAARLAHDALHDTLTGLANRTLLLDRLSHALGRSTRSQSHCALLFVDLDHFKRVNDSLGHAAGDKLLIVIAERLSDILRPGDTVARLGGDEFVILAENVPHAELAAAIGERVRLAVAKPVDLGHRSITVECSVGISLADGASPEAFLQQADTALYRAKAGGRGRWELYDQAMRLGAQRRMDTEAMIRQALGTDRIVVHHQVIVALATGLPVGSEALVRLVDNDATVQPVEFIPVAEDTGLIIPLGQEVLRRACDQQARWHGYDSPLRTVSVNLSARQLRYPGLLQEITGALNVVGLPGSALCLELTETSLIEADGSTIKTVFDLVDLGVTIALDDFGTGMSSLSHLRHFPIRTLKIDRSFVAGLGENHSDTEVVKAVIGLGRALGLTTVAEGVETPQQAAILTELGCTEAQGFLYGRPVPATDL